jgi:hypothetical protein
MNERMTLSDLAFIMGEKCYTICEIYRDGSPETDSDIIYTISNPNIFIDLIEKLPNRELMHAFYDICVKGGLKVTLKYNGNTMNKMYELYEYTITGLNKMEMKTVIKELKKKEHIEWK